MPHCWAARHRYFITFSLLSVVGVNDTACRSGVDHNVVDVAVDQILNGESTVVKTLTGNGKSIESPVSVALYIVLMSI